MIGLSHSTCNFLASLYDSWVFVLFCFFLLVLETLGATQIFYLSRQSPNLGSLHGSCPTSVGCGSDGSSPFQASVVLFDLFGLSGPVGAPTGLC